MATEEYRVIFAASAWSDLEEIVEYWEHENEPELGVKYAHDLSSVAIRQLSRPEIANAGRHLTKTAHPKVQEFRSSSECIAYSIWLTNPKTW